MAEISRVTLPVDPAQVTVIGTGGESRTRAEYVGGVRSDVTVKRDGVEVHRLTGVAVSVAGSGLDGAVVETATPLEAVEAGAVFRASGAVEVAVRADGKAGFNGGAPRGVLAVTVWVERLEPVGNLNDLLKRAQPQPKAV